MQRRERDVAQQIRVDTLPQIQNAVDTGFSSHTTNRTHQASRHSSLCLCLQKLQGLHADHCEGAAQSTANGRNHPRHATHYLPLSTALFICEVRLQVPLNPVVRRVIKDGVGNGDHQRRHQSTVKRTDSLTCENGFKKRLHPARCSSLQQMCGGIVLVLPSSACIAPTRHSVASTTHQSPLGALGW